MLVECQVNGQFIMQADRWEGSGGEKKLILPTPLPQTLFSQETPDTHRALDGLAQCMLGGFLPDPPNEHRSGSARRVNSNRTASAVTFTNSMPPNLLPFRLPPPSHTYTPFILFFPSPPFLHPAPPLRKSRWRGSVASDLMPGVVCADRRSICGSRC